MLNRVPSRFPQFAELLAEDSYWLRSLQNDLLELQRRDSEIKKCETSYSVSKLSDTCVRILINIIPKEGPFLNYEFQVPAPSLYPYNVWQFKTYLKKDFPFKPLQIFSQYHVYHPNIHSQLLIRAAWGVILGTNVTDAAWLLSTLPIRDGGAGLTDPVAWAEAAAVSS